MFAAVDFKNGQIGILDDRDGVVEYYKPSILKELMKKTGISIYGVEVDENINPIYTLDGLVVNLLYRRSTRIGKFRAVLLEKGELWGITFSSVIKESTVAFFDTSTSLSKHKYPSGQYITSYYAETLLSHHSALVLDTGVESWRLTLREMRELRVWLEYQLKQG